MGNISQKQIDIVFELYSSNREVKAIEELIILINKCPDKAELYNLLGLCYVAVKDFNSAVKAFRYFTMMEPSNAKGHFELANALQILGLIEASIVCYEAALKFGYSEAALYNNYGSALQRVGKFGESVQQFEYAIKINPNYSEAYNNLGGSYKAEKKFEMAIESIKVAIKIRPNYAEAHNNLATILVMVNDVKKGVYHYKKAIKLKPDYVEAHYNVAIALKNMGDFKSATQYFERALILKPDHAEAHKALGVIKQYHIGDEQIIIMERQFIDPHTSEDNKAYLSYALSKVFKDLGDYDKSFSYLSHGNFLRKKQNKYKVEHTKALHDKLKYYFSNEVKEVIQTELPLKEEFGIRPIFIVGMPRSGTSLTEQILSSHSEVYGGGELTFITDLVAKMVANEGEKKNLSEDAWFKQNILTIRKEYFKKIASMGISEKVITDKMPENFKFIGLILLAFPEAKIIHLKRDPIATCWSNYSRDFVKGVMFSNDFDDLVKYYDHYSDIMEFWHQKFSDKIYDLSYEHLTSNQESDTKKLLKYCNLDWQNACLNFHENTRNVKTASFMQIRKKMYQGSSNAWKKYEKHLKPLVKGLSKR